MATPSVFEIIHIFSNGNITPPNKMYAVGQRIYENVIGPGTNLFIVLVQLELKS